MTRLIMKIRTHLFDKWRNTTIVVACFMISWTVLICMGIALQDWPGETSKEDCFNEYNVDPTCFCERPRKDSFLNIAQPVNTYSNLIYGLFGIYIAYWSEAPPRTRSVVPLGMLKNAETQHHHLLITKTTKKWFSLTYALAMVNLSFSSAYLHASWTLWGNILDILSIFVLLMWICLFTICKFIWYYRLLLLKTKELLAALEEQRVSRGAKSSSSMTTPPSVDFELGEGRGTPAFQRKEEIMIDSLSRMMMHRHSILFISFTMIVYLGIYAIMNMSSMNKLLILFGIISMVVILEVLHLIVILFINCHMKNFFHMNVKLWMGFLSLISLAVGFLFQQLSGAGKALCPDHDSIFQGHAMWHFLSAFSMLIQFFYQASHTFQFYYEENVHQETE